MAYIIIKKDNQVINQVELDSSQEYTIGRSKDCDIQLDEVTISRQHLKIFFKEQHWHVQSLSKYSPLYLNNEPADYSLLKNNDAIKIVHYTVYFYDSNQEIKNSDSTISKPFIEQTPTLNLTEDFGEKTYVPEATSQEWSIGIPFIILKAPNMNDKTLRLEGDYWIIGRDELCDISLDDVKSSREHCELMKKNNSYYLLDKGSSNGTLLNGEQLPFKKEVCIKSGDYIQIGQHTLIFEIRDPHYNEKLALIPIEHQPYSEPLTIPHSHHENKRVQKIEPQKNKYQKHFYIVLGFLALATLYGYISETETETTNISSSTPSSEKGLQNLAPIDSLAPEQKEYIEKTYTLAQSLYKQGKYDLTLVEIEKIHSLLPDYKDSKDIQKFAKMAIDTLMEQNEIKRQEEDQKKIIAQTEKMITDCEISYKKHQSTAQLEKCLESPEELDPENNRISQLKLLAEQNDLNLEAQTAQRQAYKSQIERRKKLFDIAKNLEKKGKILDAISAHNRNIASQLPDPNGLEDRSKNEIAQLNKRIENDLQKYASEAEAAYGEKNYRLAIKKLEDALKLNPQSSPIKSLHEKYFQELFKKMKALYGDSVLEENLGNIESAKEKWIKIQNMDVEYGEYYKKAKSKLKKYGS